MAQEYITNNALKNTFAKFTSALKSWLPIKLVDVDNDGASEKVVIQTPEYKNIMEIDIDGNIYIIGTDSDPIKLQDRLNNVGTLLADTYEDAKQYLNDRSNLGRLVYVLESNKEADAGLYTVALDAGNHGNLLLLRIGTTTNTNESLESTVVKLESWMDNPIENKDIDEITN